MVIEIKNKYSELLTEKAREVRDIEVRVKTQELSVNKVLSGKKLNIRSISNPGKYNYVSESSRLNYPIKVDNYLTN